MSKFRQETSDPGENHANNSKNGGMVDFTGQEFYNLQDSVDGDGDEVPVRETNTSNKFNGSGGSRKTFSAAKVKGSNP